MAQVGVRLAAGFSLSSGHAHTHVLTSNLDEALEVARLAEKGEKQVVAAPAAADAREAAVQVAAFSGAIARLPGLRTVLEDQDLQQRFRTLGTYVRRMSPAQLGEFIRKEQELWLPS